jgi:hypothetical protein
MKHFIQNVLQKKQKKKGKNDASQEPEIRNGKKKKERKLMVSYSKLANMREEAAISGTPTNPIPPSSVE